MSSLEPQTAVTAADPTKFATGVVPHSLNAEGTAVPAAAGTPLPFRQYDSAGNAISFGFTPTEITTKTTTVLKVGPGMIGNMICNKTGATDVVTIYDAITATGTPIATITAPTVGMRFCEGYLFGVGCCVVTSGGTAGNYGFGIA